ncbi:tetratricopeptide repeat protein [Candidatus Sulfurimonas marisnigri]|uniref:Tetratricopeptide repeat protein n=1 Tax=Candidatus Sulfurimonas marisnigri TaxID=2740405 RepID=A0A7S7LYQ8_9BACT|nr:tetratricopeptide repeat protein [Candidatus Sulfurimonas marisnigri]QOY53948.1 tetratricopeptide repeat protein [Candidatus Sulfurimonas marisnigri]
MIRSILIALYAILLPYYLIGAEPSAFGAGNLNSPEPYGLTSSEKTLLENKKNLHKVVVKSNNQANEVDSLRERIDGLQSIVESISSLSRQNKLDLKSLNKENSDEIKSSSEFNKRLADSTQLNNNLIKENNNLILVNNADIKKINLAVVEITKLVDTINSAYVTKAEFNLLVNDINKFKDLVSKELKDDIKQKKSSLESMQSADIENEAKRFYDKKLYSKSYEYYTYLIKRNYRPARAHYMLGEIEYYRKNYSDAIAYFKKSASLYSKASYMDILMLHTAISMDNTGDRKNSKTFYNAVITKYPNSSSAKIAKNKLDLVK